MAFVVVVGAGVAPIGEARAQAPPTASASAPVPPPVSVPVRLIYDTDIGNDVDDAMALGVIHALETRGVVKLLAVTVSKDHPKAAPFIDVLNTFYGRGSIPIGVVRNGVTRDEGRFLRLVDDATRYPHDLRSGADAPEAVALLRRTLASQPDGSVTLVQVGFFTNLARLLASPADGASPLTGVELVRQKVRELSVMAGSFQPIPRHERFLEFNVKEDIRSAQLVVKDWPTPIVWSGFEIGVAAAYPHQSIEHDFDYAPNHPIKAAYYLYEPPPHDRPTWDLTAVLAVLRPDARYFTRSPYGRVAVADDGYTSFVEGANGQGRDRFLAMDALQAERVREALVWLTSTPPDATRSSPPAAAPR
jgi:inosine-uridine nucleoside N-ribohydrolase